MSINRYYLELFHNQDFLDKLSNNLHLPKFPDVQSLILHSEKSVDKQLEYAAKTGNLLIVRALIEEDDGSNMLDALVGATENNHAEVVKYLLGTGYIIARVIMLACQVAAKKGFLKIVKLLVFHIDPAYYHECIGDRVGSEKIVEFFMPFARNSEQLYNNLTRAAILSGFFSTVENEEITARRASELLSYSLYEGRTDVFYFLVSRGAEVKENALNYQRNNNLGVFNYVVRGLVKNKAIKSQFEKNYLELSKTNNERIFDITYEILSHYYTNPMFMICGTITSRNVRNFWRLFSNTDWGINHLILEQILESCRFDLCGTAEEIFRTILPYLGDLPAHATTCLQEKNFDRFEVILQRIQERGKGNAAVYAKFLNVAISSDDLALAERMIKLGAHISNNILPIMSLTMMKLLEKWVQFPGLAYSKILHHCLTNGLIALAEYCYEKIKAGTDRINEIAEKITTNLAATRFLLDHGAYPNLLLISATRSKDLRSIELTIERGADDKSGAIAVAHKSGLYLDDIAILIR
jgi:hypothetical protein